VQHLHALLRSSAFDETVLERLIDDEARSNWMLNWDVATLIDALEEAYPWAAENRHQGGTQRWLDVVKKLRAKARVDFTNMNQLRFDIIGVLNSAIHNIGRIPMDQRSDILKNIKRCFTHRDHPHGPSLSNDQFQRDLEGP